MSDFSVLIVEDETELGDLLKEHLSAEGFVHVNVAKNGQEAYNELLKKQKEDHPYSLIISDWDMPVMNGLQLLEKVRKNENLAETPFILITGVGTAETVQMASRYGVSGILLKPFDQDIFVRKVKSLVPTSQAAS